MEVSKNEAKYLRALQQVAWMCGDQEREGVNRMPR